MRVHVVQGDGATPFANAAIYSADDFRPYFTLRGYTDANGYLTLRRASWESDRTR